MRLKAGKKVYEIPKNFTPNEVVLYVEGNGFILRECPSYEFPKIKLYAQPEYWCHIDVNKIEISPKPIKAWKMTIYGTQKVIL